MSNRGRQSCLLNVLLLVPLLNNILMMFQKTSFIILITLVLFSCNRAPQINTDEPADMKTLLHDLYQNEDPELNYTRNDLHVAQLKEEIAKGKLDKRFELGIQLMSAGKEQEAILMFYEFATANLSNGIDASKTFGIDILKWVAIAHFRLGETSNCRNHHNKSSCIMPLNKEAQHIDKAGSRMALMLYAQILKTNANNPLAKWMANLSAMTLGNYPDKVMKEWYIDFEKFRDTVETFPKFTDMAQGLGINKPGHFGGAIIEDFNNDGLLDLFDTDNPLNSDVRLFIRQPNGTFKNESESAGLIGITGGANAMQTDFNNDGWVDIFITRGGWLADGGQQPESLLRNNGDGTFTDITATAGLLQFSPSQTAVWADFDNDGFLDLIVGYETGNLEQIDDPNWKGKTINHQTKVYRNNGNETFNDITANSGIDVVAWVKGATTLDYNRDGKQDVYLSIFNGDNKLYKNTSAAGTISFTEVTTAAGVQYPQYSFPTVSADFNNDGWPDLFVAGYHIIQDKVPNEYINNIAPMYPCYTYINQKDGTFKADSSFMLSQSIMAMSLNAGDLDNDGFVDIYLGTGAGMLTSLFPNIMLKNVEGKRWADVTTTSRLGHLQKCHGIAMGDLDRDGDLDLYVELGGLFHGDYFWNALYQNNLTDKQQWINLKLVGETSNSLGVGANIIVDYIEQGVAKTIKRSVSSGGSYGASPMEQHIGLGNATEIKSITIVWPSGKQTLYKSVALNNYYIWNESAAEPALRKLPAISLEPIANTPMEQQHNHH